MQLVRRLRNWVAAAWWAVPVVVVALVLAAVAAAAPVLAGEVEVAAGQLVAGPELEWKLASLSS